MKPAPRDRPVTCPYGQDGSAWATGEHGGIDYGCPVGDPVYAMWGGVVTGYTWGSAYGTQLVIDHDKLPDGSPGLWAVYAHLSGRDVTPGERVQAGQRIGTSGATGNVSGPHLHVEVQRAAYWQQGNYVNPQAWIDAGDDEMGDAYVYDYLGKPSGSQVIGTGYQTLHDSDWNPDQSGWENTYIYCNIQPTKWKNGATIGAMRLRIIRADGDATGHHDWVIAQQALDEDGRTLRHMVYWESGDGGKTHVEVKCEGGLLEATLHTRYTKKALILK